MSSDKIILEAGIDDLASVLAAGSITAVDLVAKYLLRVAKYDCRNTSLNSIPLLNERVFDEAAAADDRRVTAQSRGRLDGIPFTVKDSYKVKGMTVASGSEAFEELVANEDAFVVDALRRSGAVLLGKTNMCPMAYGGMIRGLYGRAESPYNSDYLAAAFGSGSSNGSGVATASSFAAFGMGEETVSSGRSPASNNALVAYTPSRGYISIRGNWPLYPTCDVIVPHTRTMDDLLVLLNVISVEDPITVGDFWRDQPFIRLPQSWSDAPRDFSDIKDKGYLQGKRLVVPRMYISQSFNGAFVCESVTKLWEQTQTIIEAIGATIDIVDDFPVLEAYENPRSQPSFAPRLPDDWNATERGLLIAHAWEDFLSLNVDSAIPSLDTIQPTKIFPHLPPSDPQVRFTEPANAIKWSQLASYVLSRPTTSCKHPSKSIIYDTPQLEEALHALEAMRKYYFEDWLTSHNYNYVVFPAVGDVARADADVNVDSAEHAWRNGVKYSHGNRMLRHLGIPSVTIPLGTLQDSEMPIGLTVLGRAGDDVELLKLGWCLEQVMRQKGKGRSPPKRTPPLDSDTIPGGGKTCEEDVASRPNLNVTKCYIDATCENTEFLTVNIEANMTFVDTTMTNAKIEVFIDGVLVPPSHVSILPAVKDNTGQTAISFSCSCTASRPPAHDARNKVVGNIARDSTMIMILARNGASGRPSGFLKLVHVASV